MSTLQSDIQTAPTTPAAKPKFKGKTGARAYERQEYGAKRRGDESFHRKFSLDCDAH